MIIKPGSRRVYWTRPRIISPYAKVINSNIESSQGVYMGSAYMNGAYMGESERYNEKEIKEVSPFNEHQFDSQIAHHYCL